jgi:hypothetical protein
MLEDFVNGFGESGTLSFGVHRGYYGLAMVTACTTSTNEDSHFIQLILNRHI